MDPVSFAVGMMSSRLGQVQMVSAIRMLKNEGAAATNATQASAQQPANRLANVPDHVGRNLDITV